jgi:hypothetical protein
MGNRRTLQQIEARLAAVKRDWRLFKLNRQITNKAHPKPENPTVAFFAASTRLTGISLNAAFAHLSACGLQLAGNPVLYFACQAGMSRCVLGTNWRDPSQPPPCQACVSQSQRLFAHAPAVWFSYQEDEALSELLEGLDVSELSKFEYPPTKEMGVSENIPLGSLVLPSLRWASRLHQLPDDEDIRFLFREYILSAWRVANEFVVFLDQANPQVVVVFNGVLFPEATARWLAQQRGLRVITHEVGFQPFSAFFTDQQATAYPVDIPEGFELTSEENTTLDEYLSQRFQGEFTMAGIRFWPELRKLDEDFIKKAEQFQQIVPVFTNVVFDTSQIHANTVFATMFAWLDLVYEVIKTHPETLFVIRAHPDELRIGKESRESVPDWINQNKVDELKNVVFIGPNEGLSSYDLILRSKFVMVYNSSIGLEATLLGKAVLCGGEARYTLYDTVYFPESAEEYHRMAENFLSGGKEIEVPDEFMKNARCFMYFQIFKASLPFSEYLENHTRPGYVRLKQISWRQLKTENSKTMRAMVNGIVNEKPFLIGGEE